MSVAELRGLLNRIGTGAPNSHPATRLWWGLQNLGEPERSVLAKVAAAMLELDGRLNSLLLVNPQQFPGTPSQPLTGSPISGTTCESGEPSPAELDRMAEVLHDTVYRMGARWAELHGDRRVEWREAMRAALRARPPSEPAVEAAAWAELKRGQEVG